MKSSKKPTAVVGVRFTNDELALIDQRARLEGRTRSNLIRYMINCEMSAEAERQSVEPARRRKS